MDEPFLRAVFKNLEQENINYCLIRDYDQLDQFANGGEVDLLIQDSQFTQLHSLLARLGFVSLPDWGHAPHHFFVAYDEDSDCWLKLDVVTELAYGKPVPALRTTLAASCLANRRRCGPTFAPSPEDELITLLLHCVLDKGYFTETRRQRLQALRRQVTDEPYLSTLLLSFWLPTMTWPWLATIIDTEDWSTLLDQGKAVTARLTNRDRLGTLSRQIYGRVCRKLNNLVYARRPRSFGVALLAPDGAGKSTLAAGIQNSFYFPVRSIYMGLYQKGSGSTRSSLPGLNLVRRLFTQWWRYLTARYHRARGRLVIFDRYTYDALLPSRRLGRLKRWRRWLLAHACPAPDLVVMLDAPGELLYARKGEHNAALLEQQRQQYLELQIRLPQMVIVDATRSAEYVRRQVISLIWRRYLGREVDGKAGQLMGKSTTEAKGMTV